MTTPPPQIAPGQVWRGMGGTLRLITKRGDWWDYMFGIHQGEMTDAAVWDWIARHQATLANPDART